MIYIPRPVSITCKIISLNFSVRGVLEERQRGVRGTSKKGRQGPKGSYILLYLLRVYFIVLSHAIHINWVFISVVCDGCAWIPFFFFR